MHLLEFGNRFLFQHIQGDCCYSASGGEEEEESTTAWAPYFAFRHLRKVSLLAQDTLTTYLTSVINQNQISIQRASGLLEYSPDILQLLNIRQFIPLKVLPSLWEEQGILPASYNLNRAGLIFCYRYLLLGEEAKYLPAWIYRAREGRTGNWASLFSSEDRTSHGNSDTGFYGTKILVCPSQVKFVAGMKQASPKSVGWLTTRTAAVLHRVRRIWALWHLRCADSRGTRSDRPHRSSTLGCLWHQGSICSSAWPWHAPQATFCSFAASTELSLESKLASAWFANAHLFCV